MATDEEEFGPVMEQIRRVPVKLYANEVGDKYFFLKRYSFPQQKITKLFIRYGPDQARDLNQQELGDNIVMLYDCPVECHLEGSSESSNRKSDEYLTDASFQLPGLKIRATRIRMYVKQKMEAQQQLSNGKNVVTLNCEIECRLVPSEPPSTTAAEPPLVDEEQPNEEIPSDVPASE